MKLNVTYQHLTSTRHFRARIAALIVIAACGVLHTSCNMVATSGVPSGTFLRTDGKSKYVFSGNTASYYDLLTSELPPGISDWKEESFIVAIQGVPRRLTVTRGQFFDGLDKPAKQADNYGVSLQKTITEEMLPSEFYKNEYGSLRIKVDDLNRICLAKPGDWYCILKDAKVDIADDGMSIDWSACEPASACGDSGDNGRETLVIQPGGFALKRVESEVYYTKQ